MITTDKDKQARVSKHFSRVRVFAAKANKVYIIGPQSNAYWDHWSNWPNEQGGYKITDHAWCSCGIQDKKTVVNSSENH